MGGARQSKLIKRTLNAIFIHFGVPAIEFDTRARKWILIFPALRALFPVDIVVVDTKWVAVISAKSFSLKKNSLVVLREAVGGPSEARCVIVFPQRPHIILVPFANLGKVDKNHLLRTIHNL